MSVKADVVITPQRRRPTGAPPPLPHPVSVTTRAWLVLAVVVLAGVIVISVRVPSLRLDDHVNTAVLRLFARARTPWLTDVARGISAAGSGWGATVIGLLVCFAAITLLVAGRYPKGLYHFVIGMNRWVLRVIAYAALMTDADPPFRLDQGDMLP